MLIMLVFTLSVSFISGLGVFPTEVKTGIHGDEPSDFLALLTGLDDPNMNALFLSVTTIAGLITVGLAIATRSMIPVGLYLFGVVFWTAYIRTLGILSFEGLIPGDFILIFTAGMIFVFVAAIIGMITGSG